MTEPMRRKSTGGSVTQECIQELLDFFIKNAYRARNVDQRYEIIHKRCIHLVGRDYRIEVIDNKSGQLCSHYPSELVVIEGHLGHTSTDRHLTKRVNDTAKLKELIATARFARCRSRFVMPVILFENKNVCRSATLSTMAELYGRSGVDWIFTGGDGGVGGASNNDTSETAQKPSPAPSVTMAMVASISSENPAPNGIAETSGGGVTSGNSSDSEWILLNRVRGQDVLLMKKLDISLICDLMVEKKKLKYGLFVSSSEKVDKWARYADFQIASMPYPGCEFFKDYRDNGYNPVCLQYDWTLPVVDTELALPEELQHILPTSLDKYQKWDLVELTQNYFKMLLHHLLECEGGILIHCISGWDRTPLFISLIRLSLWADDRAHWSLTPAEILYYTLAYDWLVYGHQLKERHDKGEEIMYFCFDFLKYIMTDDFSVDKLPSRVKSSSKPQTIAEETSASSVAVGGARPLLSIPSTMSASHSLPTKLSSLRPDDDVTRYTSFPEPDLSHLVLGSLKQVSLDSVNKRCHYTPNSSSSSSLSPSRHSTHLKNQSKRAHRLNEVRELFLKAYRASVPELPEQSEGPLSGVTGFLSKLAGSVLGGRNN